MRFFGSIMGTSVIVDDLDIVGVACFPAEDDPPLVVDSDAVLSGQVSPSDALLVRPQGLEF